MRTSRAGTWRAEAGGFEENSNSEFRTSNPRGFTLIELSVVIALMGIILLITYPRFENSLFASNIKQASRRLSAAVRYAQSQAAYKRKICRIYFNLDRNVYWLSIQGDDDDFVIDTSFLGQEKKLPDGVFFEDVISPRDGKVTEGQTFTQFLPKGLVDRSQIHLRDEAGRIFTLIIQPLTAEIRFFDTYVEEEWVPR